MWESWTLREWVCAQESQVTRKSGKAVNAWKEAVAGDLLCLLLLRQKRFGPQGKRAILRCCKGLSCCVVAVWASGGLTSWGTAGCVAAAEKNAVVRPWDEAGVDREEHDVCAERSDGLGSAGKRAVALGLRVGREACCSAWLTGWEACWSAWLGETRNGWDRWAAWWAWWVGWGGSCEACPRRVARRRECVANSVGGRWMFCSLWRLPSEDRQVARWGRGSCLVADELDDCRCGLRQRCGRGAGCRGARELAEEGGVAKLKERPCWALNF